MADRPKTHRRDFLRGRAAQEALASLLPEDEAAGDAGSSRAAPVEQDRGLPSTYLIQIGRRAMACEFQVFLNAGQHAAAADAAMEALDLVERLESQMTVYREDSDISRLNRAAASGPVEVERRLFGLIDLALQFCRQTDGALDITAGPLSKAWGFYRRSGRFPEQEEIRQTLGRVGYRHVELDPAQHTVFFRKPGIEINVNSIGKGYALDRCAELLGNVGVDNFLLHGGRSSILARGSRKMQQPGRPGWRIALRHPLKPEKRLAEVLLQDRAIGTSGDANQFFYHQGRRYGHVIDPRTGYPAQGTFSTTVLAPSAAWADALSTAFFVMNRDDVIRFCEQHEELGVILVVAGKREGAVRVETVGLDSDTVRLFESSN